MSRRLDAGGLRAGIGSAARLNQPAPPLVEPAISRFLAGAMSGESAGSAGPAAKGREVTIMLALVLAAVVPATMMAATLALECLERRLLRRPPSTTTHSTIGLQQAMPTDAPDS